MDRIVELAPGLGTGLLVAVCAAAVVSDVRRRRLANWLTIGALVVALALRSPGGWSAVGAGLGSAALAFAFGFPFFLLGGLGGGDVKLMAGLAAFLDPDMLVPAALVMALTGGAMAVFAAARNRSLGRVVRNVGTMLLTFVTFGRGVLWLGEKEESDDGASSPEPSAPDAVTSPYGVAIAAGALVGWFIR
ncbi:MAG: prepilin peptidase [Thermoanaerobaculia bacterium]